MRIVSVKTNLLTVELSSEDARALALALSVASTDALGITGVDAMETSGLPRKGSRQAASWTKRWRLYVATFEALAIASIDREYVECKTGKWIDVDSLRSDSPPGEAG